MGNKIRPFSHQQEAFDVVAKQQKSLYMIAGTASGKTLAVGLPLFHLLKAGEIRHVLFMYPTLALLDDQRRVMERLARITNLQVAEIKGGMSRSELVSALNCPVILATPDAVYWFFRKNVKFSSLLIYGLAQVDAFVLDEAHLFSGLSLRSLTLLKERILTLAQQLNKQPRWHILTATPHEELHALTTNGIPVHGKSKCGAVGLDLLEPRDDLSDGRSQMQATVSKALKQGAKKVLLVFNSAAAAHSTFHPYAKNEPDLPLEITSSSGFCV
ncbi:MAG: DEAD/DEAH box helicase family protein [Chloroflexi bacterium]|nr:DEAD/DEAH box helicase family protein [Chloroflexota bacterium]